MKRILVAAFAIAFFAPIASASDLPVAGLKCSGVSDFNVFINSVASALNIEAVYGIDPAQAMPLARPGNCERKQYLSGQTGGPSPGFEYLGMDSWINEFRYADRAKLPDPWPFNYLHNWVMPMYILNLALVT